MESRSSGLAFRKTYIRETTMTCAPDLASPGGCRKGFGGSKGAVPYSTNPEQDPRPSAAVPCTAEHPPGPGVHLRANSEAFQCTSTGHMTSCSQQ